MFQASFLAPCMAMQQCFFGSFPFPAALCASLALSICCPLLAPAWQVPSPTAPVSLAWAAGQERCLPGAPPLPFSSRKAPAPLALPAASQVLRCFRT